MSGGDFNCYFCNSTCRASAQIPGASRFHCPRCGDHDLTPDATARAEVLKSQEKVVVSGWIRDQLRSGAIPKISSDVLEAFRGARIPSLRQRVERLILEAAQIAPEWPQYFSKNEERLIGATYSNKVETVHHLVKIASDEGYFQEIHNSSNQMITGKGYLHIDNLVRAKGEGSQGFVAMWFDEKVLNAYDKAIAPAIQDAGYDPRRIDRKEHINKIDDEIISEIRRSRFLIADYTGHRGGVYYEAGFAAGLGISVISTCSKDDLKGLHFDVRQYNTIDWDDLGDFRRRLRRRIEAAIGDGPSKRGELKS